MDIAALDEVTAKDIYHRDYWLKCSCDQFPTWLGIALFDAAVHIRPVMAIVLLQRALRIEQDGVVGPNTVEEAKRQIPGELLIEFLSHRAVYYADKQVQFRRGFMARLFRLQRALGNMVTM